MSEEAVAAMRRWRSSPVDFCREVLGAEPDAWQVEVLDAVVKYQRICLKASKGPGKSTVLSWVAWWFLLTHAHPKVVATSISGDNLKDGLWAEMAKWQQRSELLKEQFTWHAERIVANDHVETWFMSARTWVRGADATQQANTLAGIHADNVLFVIDEAGGVPDAVVAAAEAGLANASEGAGRVAKLLIAGNPTHLSGPLYRACTTERALWWVKEISGDPDDPKRAPRISITWAREQIEKYGRDNPWVLINVFGQFPPSSANVLFDVEAVSAAMKRVIAEREYCDEPKILGVDVARFGDDRTVITLRQGRVIFRPVTLRNADTMQVVGAVSRIIDNEKPDAVFVDQTGIGAGVVDRLHQLGYAVIGVDNAAKPSDSRYADLRIEMWDKMAAWVKDGCLPDSPEYVAELPAPIYFFDQRNKQRLESKKDMKKRGLVSPDVADSAALTFAYPVAAKRQVPLGAGRRVHSSDYDPYNRS